MEKAVGIILDGKALSEKIRGEIAQEVNDYLSKGVRPPTLAVLLIGEDPASQVYVSNKEKACQKPLIGPFCLFHFFPREV